MLLKNRPLTLIPRPWWFLIWLPSSILLLEAFEVTNRMLSYAPWKAALWGVACLAGSVAAHWRCNRTRVCRHLAQVTERHIKELDVCESSAAHLELPSNLVESLIYGSLAGRILTAIAQTHDLESNKWGAPAQELGPSECATDIEIIHSNGNRGLKSAVGLDDVLGEQNQVWHLISPMALP